MEEKEPYSLLEKYRFYPDELSEELFEKIKKHADICKPCQEKIKKIKRKEGG